MPALRKICRPLAFGEVHGLRGDSGFERSRYPAAVYYPPVRAAQPCRSAPQSGAPALHAVDQAPSVAKLTHAELRLKVVELATEADESDNPVLCAVLLCIARAMVLPYWAKRDIANAGIMLVDMACKLHSPDKKLED